MHYRLLLFICFIVPLKLFSYTDSDMDGVEDMYDKCVNTPFMDVVNEQGCTTQTLIATPSFTFFTSLTYADTDYKTLEKTDTQTNTLSFDYQNNQLSLGVTASYYKNQSETYSASGFNDVYLRIAYTLVDELFYMRVGGGLVLPTYENVYGENKIDYMFSMNFGYTLENISFFGMYGFTLVNDTDETQTLVYQNTHNGSFGIGYFFNSKFYASTSYSISQSVYKDIENIKSLSLYGHYVLSESLFIGLDYMHGLSESASDTSVSLSLGYKF